VQLVVVGDEALAGGPVETVRLAYAQHQMLRLDGRGTSSRSSSASA
jgi:hypothetical protein